jgi:hypothetical protein
MILVVRYIIARLYVKAHQPTYCIIDPVWADGVLVGGTRLEVHH